MAFSFFFAPALDLRQDGGEHQVDKGNFQIKRQRFIGARHNALGGHKHLGYRNVCGKGGIFEQGNQRVEQRRERRAQCLRQHNTAHRLQIGHANAVPGFHLTSGNRFQRGADGLGTVGTLIDGKAGHSSRERVDQYAKAGQAVKHHEQLYQHRGAADDPDIKPGKLPQNGNFGGLHKGSNQRNDQRKRKRNDRKRQGDRKAVN